ncbi:MAG: hypothetical protein NE327_02170 [Lentisphaeraceae bacterium]|nr:hypothetical protein [Lentisphaeraceae bacterium]
MTLHTKELIEKTRGLSHKEFMEYLNALTTIAQNEQHVKITIQEDSPVKPGRWKSFAEQLRNDEDRNNPDFIKAGKVLKDASEELRENFDL